MTTTKRYGWLVLSALLLMFLPPAARPIAQQAGSQSSTRTYLVVYRPGPAWVAGKPMAEQPLREHGKYMLSLYTSGSLKFAGPFTDNAGGAVAFEAVSDEAAQAVVAADPAVTSRVFVAELHPWGLVDWEQRSKK
jgi:uncharacterized protein YciI